MVSDDRIGASFRTSNHRLQGTVAGSVYGYFCIVWFAVRLVASLSSCSVLFSVCVSICDKRFHVGPFLRTGERESGLASLCGCLRAPTSAPSHPLLTRLTSPRFLRLSSCWEQSTSLFLEERVHLASLVFASCDDDVNSLEPTLPRERPCHELS
jgi:hypothetical protein